MCFANFVFALSFELIGLTLEALLVSKRAGRKKKNRAQAESGERALLRRLSLKCNGAARPSADRRGRKKRSEIDHG